MKVVHNLADYAIDLKSTDGDSVTVNPGISKVDDKFVANLPPQIVIVSKK